MPRRRNRSNNNSRSSNRSISPIRVPPPSPVAPSTIQNRTTSIPNVIVDGFVWGTGVSLAKNIFGSDNNNNNKNDIPIEKTESKKITDDLWEKYNDCIKKINTTNCNDMLVEDIN